MEDKEKLNALKELKIKTYPMSSLREWGWKRLELFAECFKMDMKYFNERKIYNDKDKVIIELRKIMRIEENKAKINKIEKCKICKKKLNYKNSIEESLDLKMCYKCFNKMCDEIERTSH